MVVFSCETFVATDGGTLSALEPLCRKAHVFVFRSLESKKITAAFNANQKAVLKKDNKTDNQIDLWVITYRPPV